jgi:NADP-dependent 3-hydroxy acid dehydrogenase YdfG
MSGIVVTGASSGIGAALAEQLVARGDRVVLAARREDLLDALAARLGPNAHAVVADVTKRTDVERLRDASVAALGGVDVWVNNAGRGLSKPALELTDNELDEMILVNVKSALYGMQAIVPPRRAGSRSRDQRVVVPQPRADGVEPRRLQRVQGGAEFVDRQRAHGSRGLVSRRPRHPRDAGARLD